MKQMDFSQAKRLFLIAVVTSLSATAALAIAILLFADFDETAGRILLTTALISFFSLLSLPGGVLLDQGRYAALAWSVLAFSAVCFLFSMTVVWGNWDEGPSDAVWKSLVTLVVFAAALSQTAAMSSRRRAEDPGSVDILYLVSIALAFVVAGLASLAAWSEIEESGFYRVLGALVVANVLAVVVQPVLRRMAAVPPPPAARADRGFRVAFELDRKPPDDAVDEAKKALERTGAHVRSVDRSG